jgi:hypothetical protein
MPRGERLQHGGGRTPPSMRRRLVTQRRLSDYGFSLFRASNVDVMVRAVQGGGAQQARGGYTADAKLRHGIVAVPPWRSALWLATVTPPPSRRRRQGAGGSDVAATSDDESGLATAADSVIAPASESAATTLEHNVTAAREAVDDWHREANSPWHVFEAVPCAVCSSHPDGVAVQCLACRTFKGDCKSRPGKVGPFGSKLANGKYDHGRFVSTHLRSTKHQHNWAAFFERTMRVLPREEALPSARPAAPLPLTHLDVMRHTHAKDFEITSSTWLCRQGTLNASTTSGSLLSHLSSARCNRLQPTNATPSRSVGSWLRGRAPSASTWWTTRVVAGRSVGLSGIIAAFNCVALVDAGDSWCTLPAASLSASASQLQLKWAADRAAQWAPVTTRSSDTLRSRK